MSSVAVLYAVPAIRRLRARNALTYGGRSGLWSDTVDSLLQCWLYARPYGAALQPIIRAVALLALAVAVSVAVPSHNLATPQAIPSLRAVTAILLLGALGTVLQHSLFGAPFLVNRTASWMLLLLLLLLVLEVEVGLSSRSRFWRAASKTCSWTALAVSVVHAALAANTNFAILQYPDADTKAMLRDLESLEASRAGERHLHLRSSWELTPAIEFYRVTRAIKWLDPVADGPGPSDAAFLSPKDLGSRGRLMVWRRYPTTGNTLLVAPPKDQWPASIHDMIRAVPHN